MSKKAISVLTAALLIAALSPPTAQAAFGLKNLDVTFTPAPGAPAMQAGSHPFTWTTKLAVNTKPHPETGLSAPDEEVKDLVIDFPPGLVANPTAVPRCPAAAFFESLTAGEPKCPDASVIGITEITFGSADNVFSERPVYNLAPAPGTLFKAGFIVANVPVTIDGGVRSAPPYNAYATSSNISQITYFFDSETRLWGNPASPAHDEERGRCAPTTTGSCPVDLPEVAFITLPRSCPGPLATFFEARSWQNPSVWWESGPVLTHDDSDPPSPLGTTGCGKLGLSPQVSAKPTSDAAESPSGLDFSIGIDDEGLLDPEAIADSDIKKAAVALPEGMTANPSVAEGLATCEPEDFARESASSQAGEGCPSASKLGAVEVETPLLEGKLLRGEVFVATPNDNPFDSLLALYMTIREPGLGVMVKLAGKVEPDPRTGQLVTTFDDLPQLPFSDFRFRFREGGRSPLITPPTCGTYTTETRFTPWANPSSEHKVFSQFEISEGVAGAPCPPAGTPPFDPGFMAGSLNNQAGAHSPFFMRLTRRDGDQDLTRFDATLPPGVVAKLAGTSRCPEAQIATIKAKTGKAELASPACPANSRIGSVLAGAGVGSQLTYVPGSIYLAGPFAGAPLSVVAVVPAVAGPFDVGTVVTRQALAIDPRTAEVEVDGSRSDPIPHILAGIPLKVRDIRVNVDRPNFTLNPTDCEALATKAEIWGGGADLFSTADDSPVSRSQRFRAANCARLGFKPRLSLRLKGGTERGAHPALTAVLRPRPGDANISRASATLPRSEFLDQGHIRTICTRVQFAKDACPKGAIYGRATATTPLLDFPVQGPVYLRSSDNELPDLVADLRGPASLPIRFEVVGRTDSIRGGIRNSFDVVPDVPVSKFVLRLQGAKKGLLVNSTDICAHPYRATVRFGAHNGRKATVRPRLRARCGAARKGRRSNRG